MRSPKYPLECVALARGWKVEQAMRRLAAAAAARRTVEEARLVADRARRRHDERGAEVRLAELQALRRGDLRAFDLRGAHEWESARASEDRRLRAEADRARADAVRAEIAENEARASLVARRAEAEAIGRNRTAWNDRRRRESEAREEEATFEAWRPGR